MPNSFKVIVNSSPIIVLANSGHIDLLRAVFGEITIPEAVFKEVTSKDDLASKFLGQKPGWVHVEKAPITDDVSLMPAKLHAGEIEVILLAKSLGNSVVILGDDAARRTATFLGLEVTGTAGVLIAAKRRDAVNAVAPILDELRAAGFWLSQNVADFALRQAGEKE